MKNLRLGGWLAVVSALVGMVAAGSGCDGDGDPKEETGPTIAAICDAMCECKEGCSESEHADCVAGGEDLRDDAKAAGCGEIWEEYILCLEDGMTCGPSGPEPGSCISSLNELTACEDAAEGPCEDLLTAIYGYHEECGAAPPDLPAECSEDSEKELKCKASCQTESDCAALSGEDAEGKAAFDACYASCDGG